MRLLISLVLVLAAMSPEPLVAQKPAVPANPLEKLEVLLGSWDSEGVMNMGEEVIKWTSKHHFQRVLGDKFIREDAVISFGAPLHTELAFITFYVWNAHEERFTTFMAGNDGVVVKGDLEVLSNGAILSARTMLENGKRVIDRWVMRPMEGGFALTSLRIEDDQAPVPFVTGTMTKLENSRPVSISRVGPFMVEVPKEMQRLNRMAGEYLSKGEYAMGAGQPMTAFDGQETITPLFGGMILQFDSVGSGYHGLAFAGWDAQIKRYRMIVLNSWGLAGTNRSLFREDGQWIASALMTSGQIDMMTQTVYKIDKAGRPVSAISSTLMDGAKPFRSFEITYSPKK